MTPKELNKAMITLKLGPVAMAAAMGTSYSTFKQWRSGNRNMTPVSVRTVELLVAIKGTKIGKQFGV